MEVLLALGLLILIIIIINSSSKLLSQLRQLTEEVTVLRSELRHWTQQKEAAESRTQFKEKPITPGAQWGANQDRPVKPVPQIPDPIVPLPEPESIQPSLIVPTPNDPKATDVPKPQELVPVEAPETTSVAAASVPEPMQEPVIVFPPPPPPPAPPKPGFFERNPDLEKFIGENLISKIGIAILVIAIGFFVKYAIDQDWIGPAGRVAIGVLCGGILIGLAHRMQRLYKAFSSVLVGGGLAVLYFSIALAYKDYALFSQPIAFIIMVVITVFAIILSLLYDRQEVAIIALAGGFAVPFMVSNGSGNYVTLFAYLLVLNGGLLAIAYRKSWRLLNIIAFAATVLLFIGWVSTLPDNTPNKTYIGGLLFATAFYLLFLAVNLAHNIRERKQFIASDFGILLASNALYFSAGLYLLYAADAGAYKGLFCAALGVLNFLLSFVLVRRRNIDKSVLYLLVGVTLTFVSLTAPLQLDGHYITLFWAAETVVLFWLRQKSGIRILQWGALLVWACSLISLFMDWNDVYGLYRDRGHLLPVLLNGGFITTLFTAASHGILYRLLRHQEEVLYGFAPQLPRRIIAGLALLLLYLAGAIELVYQFHSRYPGQSLSVLYLQLYTGLFVLVLWWLARRGWLALARTLSLWAMAAFIVFCLIVTPLAYTVQAQLLTSSRGGMHFVAHWGSIALMVFFFVQLVKVLRQIAQVSDFRTALSWLGAGIAVLFVSVELQLLIRAFVYSPSRSLAIIDANYTRVGLPIIWGLCSFVLMWLGMRYKYRPLRIVSLSLFSITLLKLFLFDIQRLGPGGKIAAFFSLGVLLLIVSFMYQRLRRLIIEDERKDKHL